MKIKFTLLVMSLLCAAGINVSAQVKVAPKITAVRAQLFYDHSGKFSDYLTDDATLWNTIIGEGGAGEPSNSTFVTVEVTGQNLKINTTKIVITVTGDKNRLIQRKTIDVDIYDSQTKFYAPLWLSDTGCEKLKISARLLGAAAATKPVTKIIPFQCGE